MLKHSCIFVYTYKGRHDPQNIALFDGSKKVANEIINGYAVHTQCTRHEIAFLSKISFSTNSLTGICNF